MRTSHSLYYSFSGRHIISFNVHGVVYVGEDGTPHLFLSDSHTNPCIADVVAPIEREIRSLANGLVAVKDEQEYIVVRERTHRNTAESTNTRVKWWSILQAIVLFAVVAWQVIYLKVRIVHQLSWPFLTAFPVILRSKTCNMSALSTHMHSGLVGWPVSLAIILPQCDQKTLISSRVAVGSKNNDTTSISAKKNTTCTQQQIVIWIQTL